MPQFIIDFCGAKEKGVSTIETNETETLPVSLRADCWTRTENGRMNKKRSQENHHYTETEKSFDVGPHFRAPSLPFRPCGPYISVCFGLLTSRP